MTTLIQAQTVSAAWCDAVRATRSAEDQKLYHLIVSVERPLAEDQQVREEMDKLLAVRGLQRVETVANTIMPAALAQMCGTHDELVHRYRDLYPKIQRFPKNSWGTYFGRLVAYPIGHDKNPAPVDQLAPVITALSGSRVLAAQHEVAVATAEDMAGLAEVIDPGAIIHHPTRGRRGRGGPCLTNVAFQRQADRVHAIAHYRSHYLIERAYGNYLGLGRLLRYVASQAGLEVGRLTVVAGYAQIDGRVSDVDQTLDRMAAPSYTR
jgi:hypothetical protein